MRVEYSSNNSGGKWWLTDADWYALERAGWSVDWKKNQKRAGGGEYEDGRWLGALATRARREGLSMKDAVAEWERVTGKCSTDAGCPCCGQPHYFTEYDDDGNHVRSGPDTDYSCSW